MLIFIAQKMRLGSLNATQKHRSLPSTVTGLVWVQIPGTVGTVGGIFYLKKNSKLR